MRKLTISPSCCFVVHQKEGLGVVNKTVDLRVDTHLCYWPIYKPYTWFATGPDTYENRIYYTFRDWSLIKGRGRATKWENRGSETCYAPSQDRVKPSLTPPPPLLKGGNLLRPLSVLKTSSYHIKTTPKLFVPRLLHV